LLDTVNAAITTKLSEKLAEKNSFVEQERRMVPKKCCRTPNCCM